VSDAIRKSFKAQGRVQNIGFRWFVLETARGMKLTGWVRNSGPAVEGEAQGPAGNVAAFLMEIREGHPQACVREFETGELPLKEENDFQIRSSW